MPAEYKLVFTRLHGLIVRIVVRQAIKNALTLRLRQLPEQERRNPPVVIQLVHVLASLHDVVQPAVRFTCAAAYFARGFAESGGLPVRSRSFFLMRNTINRR